MRNRAVFLGVVLAFPFLEPFSWQMKSGPIRTLEDVKGAKIRTASGLQDHQRP